MTNTEAGAASGPIPMPGLPARVADDSKGPARITENDSEYLGLLQQVTRCGNDWRPYLIQLQSIPTADSLANCVRIFEEIEKRIQEYLDEVSSLLDEDAELRRWWGDAFTHIQNQWGILTSEIAASASGGTTDSKANATSWLAIVDEVGFSAARLTIPPRLSDTLRSVAVGDSVNIGDLFKDEIPNTDYRKRFVQELYDQVLLVDGYVDVSNDTITKINATGGRLWQPVIVAAALVVGCLAAFYGILRWGGAPRLPAIGHRPSIVSALIDVGLIWLGMLAHIAIAWYKGFRQNGTSVPRSGTRILYLISARQLAIWSAILVGAVLGYAFVLTGHVNQGGAVFAIGYSADSLVDILIPRFNASLLQLAKSAPMAFAS